ncbi:MAG TPA: tRNA uracil 4-sulfurtransferase ThiI [Nitrospiraceae bacterium]|nr:tRNA uracil 4-sulfurtransferase ThiI [Nitrospiraceae bacterium]
MRCAIIHYHELALKGRNRELFEQQLLRNIRESLRDMGAGGVTALRGRMRVSLPNDLAAETVRARLRRVFGISNFLLTEAVPLDLSQPDLDGLKTVASSQVDPLSFRTFRVSAKRADKRFPLTSMDVERAIGQHLRETTGKQVDLSRPELTVHIELLTKEAHLAVKKESGPGGMPVGVSGTIALLLSGGIDSPVAAYRMMKRGCRVVFVHFSGRPLVSRASEEKVQEIAQLLTAYQYHSRLYVVPFGEIQRDIVAGAPAPLRVVLYRRMMVRIAEELARREGCWALATGDSLGQVASQTPDNLSVTEEAAELPILRPLIGMDKVEITAEARHIGSFDISIEPDQDCCKLFVPPHPSTRTKLDAVRRIEQAFDLGAMVKCGLEKAELSEFTFPPSSVPAPALSQS